MEYFVTGIKGDNVERSNESLSIFGSNCHARIRTYYYKAVIITFKVTILQKRQIITLIECLKKELKAVIIISTHKNFMTITLRKKNLDNGGLLFLIRLYLRSISENKDAQKYLGVDFDLTKLMYTLIKFDLHCFTLANRSISIVNQIKLTSYTLIKFKKINSIPFPANKRHLLNHYSAYPTVNIKQINSLPKFKKFINS